METSTPEERWPFLTEISYLNKTYVGIVQNSDANFLHMYVIDQTLNTAAKRELLVCGDLYWWGSNRQIPINVFLQDRFKPFKSCLKTFVQKEVTVIRGPVPSLDNLINRRSKKRTVQLVRSGF
jgi:hypothetical protein